MSIDESELIARAKRDPEAFAALYDRYVDKIYAYVVHRAGDPREAEDLTARTFQKALSKLPAYEDRGLPFGAWLYRIAHNLLANWYRDSGRYDQVPLEQLDLGAQAGELGPGDQAAERILRDEAVTQAIRRLDGDRQTLLVLKFNQGLSNAEIAEVLGRSEGAVKSLYHRTLLALREQLATSGAEAPRA